MIGLTTAARDAQFPAGFPEMPRDPRHVCTVKVGTLSLPITAFGDGRYCCSYTLGSRRKRMTSVDLDWLKEEVERVLIAALKGDVDAGDLRGRDARIYVSAMETVAPFHRDLDAIAREYAEASALLPPHVSLVEAARIARRQFEATQFRPVTVAEVVAELLAHLEAKKKKAVTIGTLRSILTKFAAAFPCPIASVATAQIDTWLDGLQLAPRTLNNHRAAVLRLFNFARGRHLEKDKVPVAKHVERVSDDARGEVEIFRPWELIRILAAASDELRPAILLGAFTGLRNVELTRLDWSAVRTDEVSEAYPFGFVEVKKAAAKQHRTAARRIIPISANLAKWCEHFAGSEGPVSPYRCQSSLSRAMTRLIDQLNVEQKKHRKPLIGRPKNGLRHSFGTYRLPVLNSAAALALEMNNSVEEIVENYRELVAPKDVAAWWAIDPPSSTVLFDWAAARTAG